MKVRLATSAAIVLSDLSRLERLLWPGINAVEIGAVAGPKVIGLVARTLRVKGLGLGLHSPVVAGGVKLLKPGDGGLSDSVLAQIRGELALAQSVSADYLLLHYPWFEASPPTQEVAGWITLATRQLESLMESPANQSGESSGESAGPGGGVPLIFEMKLGRSRHPGIIASLINGGPVALGLGGSRLCLDVGDWLLACEELGVDPVAAFQPLASLVSVLHVHAVERHPGGRYNYVWKPIHPEDPDAEAVLALCHLAVEHGTTKTIVFEHTPHLDPGVEYDLQGFAWLRGELDGDYRE